MFDINFISEPGMQVETSDASWSFLHKKSQPVMDEKSDLKQSNIFSILQNRWKNYAFILIILCFLGVISIINVRQTQVKPAWVLNQVLDLIVESVYIKNLQLAEANFSMDQVKVTIKSDDFTVIQSIIQGYNLENEIPYEMYKKGDCNYLNLIFPWQGNEKGGDIQTLISIANKTVFSNKMSINHTEEIFEIHGRSSDIISFLLAMTKNKQIQKFNFTVFHHESGQFKLKVQLNLI